MVTLKFEFCAAILLTHLKPADHSVIDAGSITGPEDETAEEGVGRWVLDGSEIICG